MVDTFVTQFDSCPYVSSGLNCSCAAHAMWLYRASRGQMVYTSCQIRRMTGDKQGGTNLRQMEAISLSLGVVSGKVYQPISVSTLLALLDTGRYGTHWQGSYEPFAGTRYDAFNGRFTGNHDWYVSGPSSNGHLRVGDPGRRAGYQDIPIPLMVKAAAMLDMGGHELGAGKVYAYVTPPDPIVPVGHWKALTVRGTALWNDTTKRWVYNGANNVPVGTKLEVRGKQFPKGGVATYPVTCGSYACNYPGYYVPVSNTRLIRRVT